VKVYWILISSLLLCGCPYRSAYRLDAEPLLPVQENLLGKWATFVKKGNRSEPVKLILTQKTATEYDISITGYIEELRPLRIITNDTIKGSGFLSEVGGKNMLNFVLQDQVYLVEIKMEDGKLSFLPLAENFTSKLIRSHAELRSMVFHHYKIRLQPLYDETFCLRDLVRVN
jgi:hypothetical protein